MTSRDTIRVLIEQAIARGDSLERICGALHVTEQRVLNVLLRLDDINGSRPVGTGRHETCRSGLHDMTFPANVYVRPDGYRECRPCKRLRERQRNIGERGAA